MSDLLITNANIWTGDQAMPRAEAALVRNGSFVFVGRRDEINVSSGVATRDAGGRFVMPGFVDGHAHMLGTGFAMRSVDLKRTTSAEEAASRVAERAAAAAPNTWIRGAGWDQNDWEGARFPTRQILDAVAPEHAVVLNHTSGHCIWVNSAALKASGVTRETEAPYGGAIDVDAHGEPSGILRDTAARMVTLVIPAPTPPERIAALEDAIAHAHSLGVTGAHAMDVGRGEYQSMLALRDSGRLRFRLRTYMSAERLDEWIDRNIRTGDGDEMLRIGGVKFFADGALGSLTAWMLDHYEDADGVGFPLQPIEELERAVVRCLTNGLAVAIHAIGDRANREVLDLLERTADAGPGLLRRIEHAQLLTAPDVDRFARLGITASMQPIHATQDMHKVDRSWGDRGQYAYAARSLLASGANVAFGSDTPVETMDPLAGVHAAVTRRRANGEPRGGWYPDERISVEDALSAYTRGCAVAGEGSGEGGRIALGCGADFVILSRDPTALDDPMEILGLRVEETYVRGERVYLRT